MDRRSSTPVTSTFLPSSSPAISPPGLRSPQGPAQSREIAVSFQLLAKGLPRETTSAHATAQRARLSRCGIRVQQRKVMAEAEGRSGPTALLGRGLLAFALLVV